MSDLARLIFLMDTRIYYSLRVIVGTGISVIRLRAPSFVFFPSGSFGLYLVFLVFS